MKNFLLPFLLLACTHTDPALQNFRGFPQAFYTEQTITLMMPGNQRQLRAQLQRKKGSDRLDLVLIEPMLGIVLARAALDREGARTLYLAPQMEKVTLPLQDIGAAIRDLYEAQSFERDGQGFLFRPAHALYEYRLQSIQGPADCLYPEKIILRFQEDNYRLDIAVASFSCS